MIHDVNTSYDRAGKLYYDIITYGYYISFLLIPFTGNRNFCRIAVPVCRPVGNTQLCRAFPHQGKAGAVHGLQKMRERLRYGYSHCQAGAGEG